MAAIGDVLALLRRVTEARRGGVSRESQLRHLAAWFTGVGSAGGGARPVRRRVRAGRPAACRRSPIDDPEAIATRLSWWDAPAVELSRTLVQSGRAPGAGNGRPARVERSDRARQHLRERQLAEERRQVDGGCGTGLGRRRRRRCSRRRRRRRCCGGCSTSRWPRAPRVAPMCALAAAAFGVRLTLTPTPGRFTTVSTKAGRLHLDGYRAHGHRLRAPHRARAAA